MTSLKIASLLSLVAGALCVGALPLSAGIPVPREANTELIIEDLPSAGSGSVSAVTVFPSIESDLSTPFTHLEPFPDGTGRLAVSSMAGYILALPDEEDPDPSEVLTLLDIDHICVAAETGLNSFAFAPDYAVTGHIYVCYGVQGEDDCEAGSMPGAMWRLSRFTNAAPGDLESAIDTSSEEVLIELPQHRNIHKGGSVKFGPDGMLYVTIGDSGMRQTAQDTTDLRGSIIRIDVDSPPDPGLPYAIPADNPFFEGGPDGAETRREIYAHGFRNPWKSSFDQLSGRYFVGDVGENDYEEVNVIVPGGNYGWPMYEGPDCFDGPCDPEGLEFPAGGYHHRPGNEAIIGGYVYYGTEIPFLYGVYIFADMDGDLHGLRPEGDGTFEQFQITPGIGFPVVGFGQDFEGEIYLLPSWTSNLSIRKLVPSGTPEPSDFPTRLSDLPALLSAGSGNGHTVEGVIPYAPSAALWSDWAAKERYIALPGLDQIVYRQEGGWDFPDKSVLIKNFLLPMDRRDPEGSLRRIETRLLIRADESWHGFTYEWNEAGTDALLLSAQKNRRFDIIDEDGEPHPQYWYFPSRNDCMSCHTATSNFALGLNTAAMNFDFHYPATATTENQLRAMEYASIFTEPLPGEPEALPEMPDHRDTTRTIHTRARAYLAANCAMCHAPGGTAPTDIDLRWEASMAETNLVDRLPSRSDMGIEGARLLERGSPETSILLQRMKTLDSSHRMPPLASSEVDPEGTALIEAWINELEHLSIPAAA